MGVTDKAVSKWERDLSCPDLTSSPRLAEQLELSVEQLMQGEQKPEGKQGSGSETVDLVLRAVPLAMGVAVTVLSVLGKIDPKSAMILLGIGMASLALCLLRNGKKD